MISRGASRWWVSRAPGGASRLVLGAKTAAAAALAWFVAPYVPFADSEYSYYAPLGVLVSMYPTVWDSARSGLQALLGLGVGIPLGLGALGLVHLDVPAIVTIALVVAIGVLLGGFRFFGAGREWIPISGVFVLLLGGGDAGEFSLSYIVTMAFGVVVGVLVQLLTVPPLYLREAKARLTTFRKSLSSCLIRAAAVRHGGRRESDDLRRAVDDLGRAREAAAEEVSRARTSERGNPRARRRGTEGGDVAAEFDSLDQAALFARVLCGLLDRQGHDDARARVSPREDPVANAILLCGSVAAHPPGSDGREEAAARALAAIDAYEEPPYEVSSSDEFGISACLRRICDALAPRDADEDPRDPDDEQRDPAEG